MSKYAQEIIAESVSLSKKTAQKYRRDLVNKYLEPSSYSVDMSSDLPNGIYLLKASVNESVITKKFVVNN